VRRINGEGGGGVEEEEEAAWMKSSGEESRTGEIMDSLLNLTHRLRISLLPMVST
jgi:hypothetical protein